MARLSKEDWLKEGFALLSEFAQDKLRILELCKRLKVTRGSFYHHFSGIDNYIEALMESWEEQNTLQLIESSNAGKSPEERMEILSVMIGERNQSVEAAIRSWSFYNPVVQKHLKRVDKTRMLYTQQIFKEMGFDPQIAELKAKLEYATLIGIQQLIPHASKKELLELWEVQKAMSMKR